MSNADDAVTIHFRQSIHQNQNIPSLQKTCHPVNVIMSLDHVSARNCLVFANLSAFDSASFKVHSAKCDDSAHYVLCEAPRTLHKSTFQCHPFQTACPGSNLFCAQVTPASASPSSLLTTAWHPEVVMTSPSTSSELWAPVRASFSSIRSADDTAASREEGESIIEKYTESLRNWRM